MVRPHSTPHSQTPLPTNRRKDSCDSRLLFPLLLCVGVYNQRTVMLFDSPLLGRYAYVAIGALCVGSVVVEAPSAAAPGTNPVGGVYARGERLGYFQFGGSTVALVFQPGKIRLHDAIIYSSLSQVETLLHVNTRIGVAINDTINAGLAPS